VVFGRQQSHIRQAMAGEGLGVVKVVVIVVVVRMSHHDGSIECGADEEFDTTSDSTHR
jgi:hypothetical protein